MTIFRNHYNQYQLCFTASSFSDNYVFLCCKVNMKTFNNILFDEQMEMFLVDIKFPYQINNTTPDRIYDKYMHFGRNHFPDDSI